tara:strand:+ start:131 stop:370 length:240 start_codon:yes stop_codon:yes gene_type:complete
VRTSRVALKQEKLKLNSLETTNTWHGKCAMDFTTQELREVLRLIAADAERSEDRKIRADGLADILYEAAERLKGDQNHG